MALTSDEQRRWQELEAQLSSDRRLAALDTRLAEADTDRGLPFHTCVLWGLGSCSGLFVVCAGGMLHSTQTVAIGVDILVATLVLVGIALMIAAIAGIRRTARG